MAEKDVADEDVVEEGMVDLLATGTIMAYNGLLTVLNGENTPT